MDVVRAFIEEVQRLGGDGQPLIFLIPNIQDYSTQVQNALLKTLEEPPSGVIFLLTADHPQELLETITSRSQLIHLSPLSFPELKTILRQRNGDFEWSDMVLQLCEGRVDLALQYSKESYLKLIRWVDQRLLKPDHDFIESSDQLMALAQELSLPQTEKNDEAEVGDRAFASAAIAVFERLYMQKCLSATRQHFVALQIFNTTVEELLEARRSIENHGYVALSVEHYMHLAMARLAQILRTVRIPETTAEVAG